MSDVHSSPVVGVLLAAGLGTRFDPSGQDSKLLAALPDGTPVAVAAARRLRAVMPEVIAVVRPGAEVLAERLAIVGCRVLVAPEAAQGRSHRFPQIRIAAQAPLRRRRLEQR
ncbi:NTP transferase domain-containing protein, partial [Burkholderia gladioli]|uniref:NTP transferase domain-containing protein n=1 Tax=Burkholderia gladioli TaxID=28095 RepID=UPI0026542A0F